ncbi:thymopoietin a isoform X1 [Etheostoma spectabile]|uniref:thymopoietin a isoform X1 n=1 Tax=Etheostoma spectabile TaxID=54343 RepID=UPI0013AFD56C|nr:thymopoietin isoform X1 [Etheostoma spectabile]
MPEYLDDPSVLTKDKLKSELLAHNIELPSGNPTKDVYVQLYLKNLTANNKKHVTATTLDAFSSDEELPPPVLSSRSRSSGRKATRKTDKVRPDELDVTMLTDAGLKDELLKHGVDAGPIVASTRKVYEKKLQRLLDEGPTQLLLPKLVLTEIQVNHNGNSESDLYSDKEDEVTPEPVAEPESVPVVERLVRSKGKTPVTTRSSQHHTIVTEDLRPVLTDQIQLKSNKRVHHRLNSPAQAEPPSTSSRPFQVEKIAAGDQAQKVEENDVLKEIFPNDISSPTGITATCRRPIRGAAGRPVKSSDLWNDENCLFSPKNTKTTNSSSSYTESCTVNRVSSLPTSFTSSSSSRLLSGAPPAGPTKAAPRSVSLWKKLFLLAVVAVFLFLVYQAMETNGINPFETQDIVTSDSAV